MMGGSPLLTIGMVVMMVVMMGGMPENGAETPRTYSLSEKRSNQLS
jgi:hypothetical protein